MEGGGVHGAVVQAEGEELAGAGVGLRGLPDVGVGVGVVVVVQAGAPGGAGGEGGGVGGVPGGGGEGFAVDLLGGRVAGRDDAQAVVAAEAELDRDALAAVGLVEGGSVGDGVEEAGEGVGVGVAVGGPGGADAGGGSHGHVDRADGRCGRGGRGDLRVAVHRERGCGDRAEVDGGGAEEVGADDRHRRATGQRTVRGAEAGDGRGRRVIGVAIGGPGGAGAGGGGHGHVDRPVVRCGRGGRGDLGVAVHRERGRGDRAEAHGGGAEE